MVKGKIVIVISESHLSIGGLEIFLAQFDVPEKSTLENLPQVVGIRTLGKACQYNRPQNWSKIC